ncbi:hypothetical protein RO21_10585 [[Actinobacillus] muris]|uniref:Uncharacterized protein n=1 Tax=Muribacter muris TaxID=67855 RepID=A0A0J5P592_9PAST|nr:hypothetical protein [Muribacter muris]KMK50649.1 hypothetical protein RO21_10585 [[Actinobacillus] muris] [Muribacter muris]
MALITLDQYTIIPRPEGDFVLQHREGEVIGRGNLKLMIIAIRMINGMDLGRFKSIQKHLIHTERKKLLGIWRRLNPIPKKLGLSELIERTKGLFLLFQGEKPVSVFLLKQYTITALPEGDYLLVHKSNRDVTTWRGSLDSVFATMLDHFKKNGASVLEQTDKSKNIRISMAIR